MKFKSPYWTKREKANLLQRWILVHSYLYYDLDNPVVSDYMFDMNCNQLYKFKKKLPKTYKKTNYYYAMYDFDGSTGVGFMQRLDSDDHEKITRDASYILHLVNNRRRESGRV